MKKKLLSLALALVMMCCMIPVSASAANPVTISEHGMSITMSDVVSYEDVTICHPVLFDMLEDFDLTLDDCIENIRIYHLTKSAAVTLKNIGENGDDWHTDTMFANLTNAYLNKNYKTESGIPLPYPCFNEWEAMWNAEDDDEFIEYIGSWERGESSGKFFPKLPTELGKLSRIYLQIGEAPNDPFYGDVGGIHGELNIYCAYDNGEYSFTDNAVKNPAQSDTPTAISSARLDRASRKVEATIQRGAADTLIAAVYDGGKLLEIIMEPLSTDGKIELLFTRLPEGCTVKLMPMGSWKPLCKAATL